MDLWVQCNPATTGASPGTALTTTILTSCITGSVPGLSVADSNLGNHPILMASSQTGMGGTITVGGTTYPTGTPTAAMTYDPSINGDYVLSFTPVSSVVWNGELTLSLPPFATSGLSTEFNYGSLYTGVASGVGANNQLWIGYAGPDVATSYGAQPGNCPGVPAPQYFMDIEVSGLASISPVNLGTWRSLCTYQGGTNLITPGNKYFFSMKRDGTNHTVSLALADAATMAIVYSQTLDISLEETTPVTISSLVAIQVGASTATSGYVLTFENYMLDVSGHCAWPCFPH